MAKPPKKELLKPYYYFLKQVIERGEPITLTEGNLADYGLRPVLNTALFNLRAVPRVYGASDPEIAAFPLRIRRLRGGTALVVGKSDPQPSYNTRKVFHNFKHKSDIYNTIKEPSPTAFNAFFLLFSLGYLKGHVIFAECSDRIVELAEGKDPSELFKLEVIDNTVALKTPETKKTKAEKETQ